MPRVNAQRESAIEAASLLNLFLLDFIIGTRGLEIYDLLGVESRVPSSVVIGLNRMALSHLVVTLSKWTEFYRRYKAILPDDVRDECRALNKDIVARGIVSFRNTVVGHICDKDTGRPLTSHEIDERLERIMAGQGQDFLRWINNPTDNTYPCSVVAITEHVRDRLRDEYRLANDEIL